MSDKLLGFAMAWIFYWSIFAVGQLSTTIQHMNWYDEYVLGVQSQETPLVLEEKLNNQVNNPSTSGTTLNNSITTYVLTKHFGLK